MAMLVVNKIQHFFSLEPGSGVGKKGETKSLGRGKGGPPNLASLALSSLQPLIFFLLFYLVFKANEKGEEHSVSMHKVMLKQYVDFLGYLQVCNLSTAIRSQL